LFYSRQMFHVVENVGRIRNWDTGQSEWRCCVFQSVFCKVQAIQDTLYSQITEMWHEDSTSYYTLMYVFVFRPLHKFNFLGNPSPHEERA